MNTEKKNKIIFNQRLAGYLMLHGFVLIDMRQDSNKSGRNVFFFKESKELLDAINEYKNSKTV